LLNKVVSSKNIPVLLIILFVVHGLLYAGMYPLWDPWDEPAHFAHIQFIVEEKMLPTTDDHLSNEIVFTFDKLPMIKFWNYLQFAEIDVDYDIGATIQSQNFSTYWNNFAVNEILENRELISSQPLESRTTYDSFISLYEAHPPIGYLIQVPIYTMFYDQDILTRVFALRIFSVFVAAVAAIFVYKTISLIFQDRFMRIGSLMFIVFNPMFMTDIARVTNETTAILLFSIFLYLMVLYLKGKTNTKHIVLIGVVLGLGLLTKPTFMPAVALVPIFIFLRYIQNNADKPRLSIPQSLKNLGIIFGVTIPMVSWWYFEKFATGNFAGIEGIEGLTFAQYIEGAIQIPWITHNILFFHAFWGLHGMSFLIPPISFFFAVLILVGITTVGLGFGIVIKIKQLGRKIIRNWKYQSIFALALSIVLIMLAQSVFSVQNFIVLGYPFTLGHFTFIAFTAISMILMLGYRTIIINTRLKRFKNSAFLWAFIILIIFSSTTFYWFMPNWFVDYQDANWGHWYCGLLCFLWGL